LITEKEDEQSLIINGKREGWFDKVYNVTFTDDGKRYAYIVQKELTEEELDPLNPFKEGKFYVVVDGVKSEEFDYVVYDSLKFSHDGKRFAYIASNGGNWGRYGYYTGGKWFVVVDGKKSEEYDSIDLDSVNFSSNGKHLIYIAKKGYNKYLIINGEKIEIYGKINKLLFNFDESMFAFINNDHIVVDNHKSRRYDDVYDLNYLIKEDTFLALTKDGKDILLVEYTKLEYTNNQLFNEKKHYKSLKDVKK